MLQPAHPPPASHPAAPHGAEKELAQHRTALAAVTAERDSLREDLAAVKEAKRRADQGFKSQLDRANALDKELAFYQVGLGWWWVGAGAGCGPCIIDRLPSTGCGIKPDSALLAVVVSGHRCWAALPLGNIAAMHGPPSVLPACCAVAAGAVGAGGGRA